MRGGDIALIVAHIASAARYFFNIPLQSPGNECLTLVLNRDSGRALLVRSTLLPEQTVEKGSRLKQSFHVGLIAGVTPGGLRISLGIEHIEDIKADITQALSA